ncbi:lipopolysaccharide transport periplasmic protein LptA [Pseudothauera lacus]|uniref:Lipopolysaccharide export system protein LptA n=1 Tax=Pseudothauera lacus TaxID=2136175 RepID=A0A2T4IG60_9RHOO|nr:lipopolysaccharide transport periplasmic protein LptA [Pseudothauera lacus]PTD96686.1 lipopolysaccharide transport periplasmic protein LptA [Pseudothauera lacus]
MTSQLCRRASLLACLLIAATPAWADRSDRTQPVDIEANHVTVDDRSKTHVFEGEVILTQGSLQIRGDRLVVTQGADGFQTGVATASGGRLATFRQRREGTTNEYVEGEAERVEYDSRNERVRLFVRAYVKSGGDEVRGPFIEYNTLTENYVVSGSSAGDPASASGRVRAVIQPKGGDAPAPQ